MKYFRRASKLTAEAEKVLADKEQMASQPKRPDDRDNVVSLREARARQAAQARSEKNEPAGGRPGKKMPVMLIFLGLLAIVVAARMLLG